MHIFSLKLNFFNLLSLLKHLQMQTIFRTFLVFFLISAASVASACHEGDLESLNKGHHKWGKSAGIFQFTENSTISFSTSSSCDLYTAFLENEYYFIQEQVAYGHGPHLDALAMITGCNPKVRYEFSQTLRSNYKNLFSEQKNSHELRNGIEKLIKSNTVVKASCIRA